MAKRGANVSIIARSKEKLEEARRLISGHLVRPDQQKVVDCSVDISARDTSVLDSELKSLAASQGPIFMLVNCAGFSIPSKLETLTNDQVTKAILGTNGSFGVAGSSPVERWTFLLILLSSLELLENWDGSSKCQYCKKLIAVLRYSKKSLLAP